MKEQIHSEITVDHLRQQFALGEVEVYDQKKDLETVQVISLKNVDKSSQKLAEIVTQMKPKIIKCKFERRHEEGGYANISFSLTPQIDITGTVYFANMLSSNFDFQKIFENLGYQQANMIDVEWGMCDYILQVDNELIDALSDDLLNGSTPG